MNKWLDRFAGPQLPFFTLCLTERDFRKTLKRIGIKEQVPFLSSQYADATTHRLDNDNGAPCAIVCLRSDGKREHGEVYGLLIHEAVHIWQFHKEAIGDTPSHEAEAYGIQWIAQQLIYEWARQTHG